MIGLIDFTRSLYPPPNLVKSKLYDVVIIGAGLSGLAAALRLGMFGKQVLLLEKHYVVGGLNSFYAKEGKNSM